MLFTRWFIHEWLYFPLCVGHLCVTVVDRRITQRISTQHEMQLKRFSIGWSDIRLNVSCWKLTSTWMLLCRCYFISQEETAVCSHSYFSPASRFWPQPWYDGWNYSYEPHDARHWHGACTALPGCTSCQRDHPLQELHPVPPQPQ